jgi:phosphopantothenoylcysteine decarboxylase/phosphopantothenate--cysteine ligase
MGYAVSQAAVERGADVILVSGPVAIDKPMGVEYIQVTSADEMYDAVMKNFKDCDAVVMSAAVADYKAAEVSDLKIKKQGDDFSVQLVKNVDILKELGRIKEDKILAGFAAETDNLLENAAKKIKEKNLDIIVANDVTMEGAGFGTDTNIIKILRKDGTVTDFPLMSKLSAAHCILDEIIGIYKSK